MTPWNARWGWGWMGPLDTKKSAEPSQQWAQWDSASSEAKSKWWNGIRGSQGTPCHCLWPRWNSRPTSCQSCNHVPYPYPLCAQTWQTSSVIKWSKKQSTVFSGHQEEAGGGESVGEERGRRKIQDKKKKCRLHFKDHSNGFVLPSLRDRWYPSSSLGHTKQGIACRWVCVHLRKHGSETTALQLEVEMCMHPVLYTPLLFRWEPGASPALSCSLLGPLTRRSQGRCCSFEQTPFLTTPEREGPAAFANISQV